MVTNIRQWGNSQGLCIPKPMLKQLGISLQDKVELIIRDDSIVIRKDSGLNKKAEAYEQLKALRRKSDNSIGDYKQEYLDYLDEKYSVE